MNLHAISLTQSVQYVSGPMQTPRGFNFWSDGFRRFDALDPLAKIPEDKACAVRIVAAVKEELPPTVRRDATDSARSQFHLHCSRLNSRAIYESPPR
jgi:hypothetical protein